jgi:NADH:ubiquinone oxidoreductase subunit 4 (subunit M)
MIDFILIAFMAACLEMAYQHYQTRDMIFQKLGLIFKEMYNQGGLQRSIAMVLGSCPYCNGFWVAVITYIACFKSFDWFLFLFCGVNFLFIKLLITLFKSISHEN